jgi:hypothetical protein
MTRSNRWADNGSVPGAHETAMIQHQIGRVMGDVMMDARRSNPNALLPVTPVKPVGAVSVAPNPEPVSTRGWRDEIDLRLPPGQDAIRALADHFLPGPALTLEQTLAQMRGVIRGLTAEQRAQALVVLEGRKDQPSYLQLKALLEEAK